MERFLRKRGVRLALLSLVVLGALVGVYLLKAIFAPLILGFLVAYVLDPFADALESRRLPRVAAVIVIFLVGILTAFGILFMAGLYAAEGLDVAYQRIMGEERLSEFPDAEPPVPGVHFVDNRPENGEFDEGYVRRVRRQLDEFKDVVFPGYLSRGIDRWLEKKQKTLESSDAEKTVMVEEQLEALYQWGKRQLEYTVREDRRRQELAIQGSGVPVEEQGLGLFPLLSYLVLLPLYVFFFLLEIDPMIAAVRRYLPAEQKERIERIFFQIDRVLAAFFRGRLIVCLVKGALLSAGLLTFGVPFWLPLGLAGGFLSLIPYVGIYLSLVPALVLVWFDSQSYGAVLGVLVLYGALELIEGFVLIPKFLGREVGLHPLTIIVTLLIFGKVFGFIGVLLSVPLAAITKILAAEFLLPLFEEFAEKPIQDSS